MKATITTICLALYYLSTPLLISTEPQFNMNPFPSSSNLSFKFSLEEIPYVLRIGKNREELGIDRLKEATFYKIGEELGIAPQIMAFNADEQILISKYIENFNSLERTHETEMINKIIDVITLLHSYPTDNLSYPVSSIFARNDRILQSAEKLDLLSQAQKELVDSWMETRKSFENDYYHNMTPSICHGDLYYKNILENEHGKIYLVDWEYSFYGYPIDDLGKLCSGNDFNDDEIAFVARQYYKSDDPSYYIKLKQNIFMRQFSMYIWCQIQASCHPERQSYYEELAKTVEVQLQHLQLEFKIEMEDEVEQFRHLLQQEIGI